MGAAFEVQLANEVDKIFKSIQFSTTIKRKWIDLILSGKKKVELKSPSDYWNKRFRDYEGRSFSGGEAFITFVCGHKVYKYAVTKVWLSDLLTIIDGVKCKTHWRIVLGQRVCRKPDLNHYCEYRETRSSAIEIFNWCACRKECILESG